MIPYGHQSIDANDVAAVTKVLRSDWLTQGPRVEEFEKELAKYCGAKYAAAVANGTAALHLAYLASGLGAGDEVITSPNTYVATTNMLLICGVRPVFVDIRLDTYNLDENKIKKAITSRTKAIVPVHFAGQPGEMETILKIARKHKILIIEDACHALGAKYKNRKIGTFGDMTVFSFHPVKAITTGEGGAVLTNNERVYKKIKLLRSHGVTKDEEGFNVMTELGYNYRMTDIQATLGSSQLKKLEGFLAKRHQVVEWYGQELKGVEQVVLPVELPENYSGWHIYVIRTKSAKDRLPLMKYLKENGIGVNFHYPAVYAQPFYRRNGFKNFRLPNEEVYQNTAVTLPLFPGLTRDDIRFICQRIKDYYKM